MEMKRRVCGNCSSQDRIIRTLKDFKTKMSKVKVTRSCNSLAAKAVSDGHIDSNLVRISFSAISVVLCDSVSRLHTPETEIWRKCCRRHRIGPLQINTVSVDYCDYVNDVKTHVYSAPDAERWDRRRWRRLGWYLPAVACALKHRTSRRRLSRPHTITLYTMVNKHATVYIWVQICQIFTDFYNLCTVIIVNVCCKSHLKCAHTHVHYLIKIEQKQQSYVDSYKRNHLF